MKKLLKRVIILIIIVIFFRTIFYKQNANPKIVILDENNDELVYLINMRKTNKIDKDKIPKKQIDYIIAIEDKDFYTHKGYSIKRIFKSIFSSLTNSHLEGASTITQQVVKNVYLDDNRFLSRKLKEIYLANKLEKIMTKDEILNEYLSVIYFGNGVYGLQNAAKYYYTKNYYELTDTEMISLIALWNSPSIYSNDIKKWEDKKAVYIKSLANQGLINPIKINQNINLRINKSYIPSNRQFFIDSTIQEINEQRITSSFGKDITITTDYSKKIETIGLNIKNDYAVFAYNKKGYIKGIIGGKDYYSSTYNIVELGNRDIGSTIKPLLYYELLKCNMDDLTLSSEPYTYSFENKVYSVTNSNNIYYGNIDLKKAIAVSDNVYAMKVHLMLGMNTLRYHLKDYGIEAEAKPSAALGSISMSLRKIVNIYSQFFNNGKYIKSRFIKSIKADKTTNIIPVEKSIKDKVLCNKIKEYLSYPFSNEIENATCNIITNKLITKCYGKSGLTDYDSYMIGFSETYIVGVWSGNSDGKELTDSKLKKLPKELFVLVINALESK